MFNPLLDKYDKNSANISIFPGVGGDDAKDWANMLLNMYVKYAAKRKWKVIQVDDRSIDIKGEFAYGNLKKETGVHRLVRISPFDSKQLRHTSFALVEVLPEIPEIELKNLNIPPEDLKMETSRSSGPGGQNVNKRDTAVRVVHLPTGLAAASQVERSQAQNKEKALSLLKAKLFKIMVEKQENEIKNLRTQVKPEWGNQIRSYVLHPYQQVKDHRTGMVSHQPDKVLNGELEKFIEAELDTKTDA
ncbi:MAG: PCRF domain-containing protein [Patescibacteria group bacterium]|nr:PCRF domain-containing protein [Patescibacteria group bacterium]